MVDPNLVGIDEIRARAADLRRAQKRVFRSFGAREVQLMGVIWRALGYSNASPATLRLLATLWHEGAFAGPSGNNSDSLSKVARELRHGRDHRAADRIDATITAALKDEDGVEAGLELALSVHLLAKSF